jgi:trk system potassium uptake protein TrkA
LGIPTVATSLWTTQQVKRWITPSPISIEWTDGTGTLQLVERIAPDALAGHPISHLNSSEDVRVVGLVRAGQGRVNVDDLFAQEGDVLEILVTPKGLIELQEKIEEGEK